MRPERDGGETNQQSPEWLSFFEKRKHPGSLHTPHISWSGCQCMMDSTTIWDDEKSATSSHCCFVFFCNRLLNITISVKRSFLRRMHDVFYGKLKLSNAGWACSLNVPLTFFSVCASVCLFFVLESWLALNYWSDVSVALFRVVKSVAYFSLNLPTNAAFQIFLKKKNEGKKRTLRSVWVNFTPV